MSPRRFRAALAVALLTAAAALFLRYESARHEATGAPSTCAISARLDCDAVQASPYAKVMGVSLSTLGAAGALVLLLWLLGSRRDPALLVATGTAAALAVVVVLYTAVVSWVVLRKLCLYCSVMQAGFVALAVLVVPAAWRARRAAGQAPRRPLVLGGTVAVLLLALALSGDAFASEQSRLARMFDPSSGKGMRLDISDSLLLGDPRAPIGVVMFFDFGCPTCSKCVAEAAQLVRRYPHCVHFRFKHYPLDRACNQKLTRTDHHAACAAAIAGQAAQSVGLDARALEVIFSHQGDGYGKLVLAAVGDELGVAREKWAELLASPATRALVERDVAEGNALQLTHVPFAFVNGRPVDAQRLPEAIGRLCR